MKKIIISALTIVTLLSCSIDSELNIDQKNPTKVSASGLFTNGTRTFFDYINSASVNRNVFRLYAQYWSQTTYPDESQFNQTNRKIPDNTFSILYRGALKDLKEAKKTFIENNAKNLETKKAIVDVVEVYAYTVLVDMFGNVPYSEALTDNKFPKYDDAKTIYEDLLKRLSVAITNMKATSVDMGDPIYGGDVSLWKKAANSLKLRMAMRLVDVDAALSKKYAEEAAKDVIGNNAENFGITYYGAAPNTNPLWVSLVQSGRDDFVGADTMIDLMNPIKDPRLPLFFNTVEGVYKGGIYGSANASNNYSALSDNLKNPSLKGSGISYAEVKFLLAEAVARGYNVSGTAQEHYNAAIIASITEWGGTELSANVYLKQAGVSYDDANWKKSIALQKWIALFNNGFEGWTTYRLFDYPELKSVGSDKVKVPTRFVYPENESGFNGTNKKEAVTAMGGDKRDVKIFWDKN